MKRLIKTLALIAALSSVLNAVSLLTAGAQSTSNIVTLRGSSVSPLPKQVFTITANTPLYKPQEAIFNWTVNGRFLASDSGRGKDSISVLAGAVGSSIIAEVEVTHLERDPASATREFIIMDLALTWSAKTYVPKWYKGKPLPSASSIARVTAVPNVVIDGRRLGPKELIFTWDLGIQRGAVSGPGEDSVELQVSDIPNNGYRIYVTVEDLEKRVQQGAARTVRPLLPKLVTYALSPLGGVEPRSSLKTAIIKEHEARDFVAEPFFFPITTKKELAFKWLTGPFEVIGISQRPYILTVDTGGVKDRGASINVSAQQEKPLLSASTGFNLVVSP